MELQFEKTQWECLQSMVSQVKNEEHTTELRLPESMPDLGRVLGTWGQVLLRGKEWRSNGMNISGGVMVWVLYQPEDGSDPRSVEGWIPFQTRWDFPKTERDGVIWASCLLRGIDARGLSARKLMVRAGVSMMGEALEPIRVDIYTPGQVPEDVHLLRRSYPVSIVREAGEKGFALDEELAVPTAMGQVEQIVRWELCPEIIDRKVMAGKVVFRGSIHGHVLFRAPEGELKTWDFEVPFSQFEDLQREYGEEADARIVPAVTGMELEILSPDLLRLKAGLVGQYVISDRPILEVVEDAYSNTRKVTPLTEELPLHTVLDRRIQTAKPELRADTEGQKIVDTAYLPSQPFVHREEGGMALEQSGEWHMLLLDRDGRIQGQTLCADTDTDLSADSNTRISAFASSTGLPQSDISGGHLQCRADVLLDTWSYSDAGIPMLCGLDLGDPEKPDPDRPSMILRRCGSMSLWDLAKRNRSTVSAIRDMNGLEGEPDDGQILLIPVMN